MKIIFSVLGLIALVTLTVTLYFTSQLKERPLGEPPNLAGKSILFEKQGEGIQLFWRNYKEGNEYTDEYVTEQPVEGELYDVMVTNDGTLFYIVHPDVHLPDSPSHVYVYTDGSSTEIAQFSGKIHTKEVQILDDTHEAVLVENNLEDWERSGGVLQFQRAQEEDEVAKERVVIFSAHSPHYCNSGGSFFVGAPGLPCFGYFNKQELIRLEEAVPLVRGRPDKEVVTEMYTSGKTSTLFATAELMLPFKIKQYGSRFARPLLQYPSGYIAYFVKSEDTEYRLFFTTKEEQFRYVSTNVQSYILHIDSGQIMKLSDTDIPVLMR